MNKHHAFIKLPGLAGVLSTLALCAALPQTAWALLPPANVECCHRKDYASDRCRPHALSEEQCVKVYADWNTFYQKFMAAQQPPKVTAKTERTLELVRVEARLYFAGTATFSEPLTEKVALWNTIIGEGSAGAPSNALRVDVVLSGEPESFKPKQNVSIDVVRADNGKLISRHEAPVGAMGRAGNYVASFMLQDTGCDALKITAKLSSSDAPRSIAVPFACGE
jgi:hypothetical protein